MNDSAREARLGVARPPPTSGPRQTGKSTLLRETYSQRHWVDLLKAEEFRRYLARRTASERLASGIEVDFILGDTRVAIEAKSSERITRDHLQGLRSFAMDHPRVGRRIVVCREPRARKTDDGIEILPDATFVQKLWHGELS